MSWLDRYRKDLEALEMTRSEVLPVSLVNQDHNTTEKTQLLAMIEDILKSLRNAATDQSAINQAVAKWWQTLGKYELASLRKEIPIERNLAPLYERLATASDAQLEEFARLRLRFRLQSPLFRLLANGGDKSEKASSAG